MVIDNLDPFGTRILPHKAQPPLVVDPNTVLTGTASVERLSRLPGGAAKSLNSSAAWSWRNFRCAVR
jgi:hypothetical protein